MASDQPQPLWRVHSQAPIRICDLGGWTDTWFAEYGTLLNIAVSPYAEVQIQAFPADDARAWITLDVENFGDRYALLPGPPWGKHPLLEAAVTLLPPPPGLRYEISVFSEAPAGASTGTSAAVSIALLGGLALLRAENRTPAELASLAHHLETKLLGLQSGIQDQISAAYGGINYIEMHAYPQATVTALEIAEPTCWDLEQRLALVYLGQAHASSDVHEMVIRSLKDAGPRCPELTRLRQTAPRARQALLTGDLAALGQAMIANTFAQQALHPALVNEAARSLIEIARHYGALGWKVNGAGGAGGSLSILCGGSSPARRTMLDEIKRTLPLVRVIPLRLSPSGQRAWKTGA